ncbi:MAG: hypothetical protein HKP55_12480 [Gammaproteobacteria bacterium]|nr:hypothetical protein [Gammaproteobacteria bacterium]
MDFTVIRSFVLVLLIFNGNACAQATNNALANNSVENRVALVIGNGGYQFSPLMNPVNDATDMAAVLKQNGFEVILKLNANQKEMQQSINQFGKKLNRKGGTGLFYYAGHGIQLKGRNYLIPIGALLESESDIKFEAIDAGRILGKMEDAENSLNIVVLDACRNNPFARSFRSTELGLAKMDAPTGSLIAYATAPGSVAADGEERNGLYTKHLLKYLNQPNLEIEDVFKQVRIAVVEDSNKKQVPWESSSLIGDFVFSINANSVHINAQQQPKDSDNHLSPEDEYWVLIRDSSDPLDFTSYIEQYKNGKYEALAKLKLRKLANLKTGPVISLIENEWSTWQESEAKSNLAQQSDNQVGWSYSLPEVNGKNFTGLSVYMDKQNLSNKNIRLQITAKTGLPLEFGAYAFINGYSKENDFNSLVQATLPLNLKPGENDITLNLHQLKIPDWWMKERNNPSIAFSLNDVRTLEFTANPNTGPASDTLLIRKVEITNRPVQFTK